MLCPKFSALLAVVTIVSLGTPTVTAYDDSGLQQPLYEPSEPWFRPLPTSFSTSSSSGPKNTVLTPEVSVWIKEWMNNGTIPGLALSVVHLDGETEFIGLGNRTEEGDPVAESVRLFSTFLSSFY